MLDVRRALFAGSAILGLAPPAEATTITVGTTDDELNADGDCSLREAIQAANGDTAVDACPAGAGADTVVLAAATYALALQDSGSISEDANASGDLDVTDDLVLQGAGMDATWIVDLVGDDQVDRILDIQDTASFEATDLTVSGGYTDANGAGIRKRGDVHPVTLRRVRLYGNTANNPEADVWANGGGFAGTVLTMEDCLVDHNVAEEGGGLFVANETVTDAPPSAITRTAIVHNAGTTDMGGFFSLTGLTVLNSTISENQAPYAGAGAHALGDFELLFSTVAFNRGTQDLGGLHLSPNPDEGSVTIKASLISNNPSAGPIINCYGLATSGGYNVSSTDECFTEPQPTDALGYAGQIAELGLNGAVLPTHALRPDSPALDAIPLGECEPVLDQRLVSRPQGGACDVGAFEAEVTGELLMLVTDEAPGAFCANGGYRIDVGHDDDLDGVLDPSEIEQTEYACHGDDGATGPAGSTGATGPTGPAGAVGPAGDDALVNVTDEPPGANCDDGGVRFDAGTDGDGDGTLAEGEIESTSYMCLNRAGCNTPATAAGGASVLLAAAASLVRRRRRDGT